MAASFPVPITLGADVTSLPSAIRFGTMVSLRLQPYPAMHDGFDFTNSGRRQGLQNRHAMRIFGRI